MTSDKQRGTPMRSSTLPDLSFKELKLGEVWEVKLSTKRRGMKGIPKAP